MSRLASAEITRQLIEKFFVVKRISTRDTIIARFAAIEADAKFSRLAVSRRCYLEMRNGHGAQTGIRLRRYASFERATARGTESNFAKSMLDKLPLRLEDRWARSTAVRRVERHSLFGVAGRWSEAKVIAQSQQFIHVRAEFLRPEGKLLAEAPAQQIVRTLG